MERVPSIVQPPAGFGDSPEKHSPSAVIGPIISPPPIKPPTTDEAVEPDDDESMEREIGHALSIAGKERFETIKESSIESSAALSSTPSPQTTPHESTAAAGTHTHTHSYTSS